MAGKRVHISELTPFLISNVHRTGRELGKGAYGSVEEVIISGAVCAAKNIHTEFLNLGNPDELGHITSKFVSECELMTKLRHPHIVQFLGVCYFPGSSLPSLIMERLDTNLHDLLETTPNLPLDTKRSVLLDIARGLLYLHSQLPPIIHRDLTAKNVLLNTAMTAKIADMGVARIINIQPHQLATMTQGPGNIVYMPPEAIGELTHYNSSLDIFSFGNLALFTLTQEFVGTYLKAATYTDPQTGKITARSEIERRKQGFHVLKHQLGDGSPFVKLTEDCLQNLPSVRPTAPELVDRIQEIPVEGEFLSRLELMRQLSTKEAESEQLQSEASEKDDHISSLEKQVLVQKQEIVAASQEVERKKEQLRELEEKVSCQEEQIKAIEERLNKISMQASVPSELEELGELRRKLGQVKPVSEELRFPLSFAWEKSNDLPYGIPCNHSFVLNGKIYVSNSHDILEKTPEKDAWVEVPTPVDLENFAILSMNGNITVVGGEMKETGEYSRKIYVWDIDIQRWTEPYPPLPVARQHPGCVYYDKNLIVPGGVVPKSSKSSSTVDVLDTRSGQWYKAAPMPCGGDYIQSVVIGENLYVLSRFTSFATSSKQILRVSLPDLISDAIQNGNHSSSIWEKLPNVPHYDTTLFSIGNLLLTAGGRTGGTVRTLVGSSKPVADIHLFNPYSNEWVKVSKLPEARWSCACIMLPSSGQLLVAGGACGGTIASSMETMSTVYTATVNVSAA